MKLKLDNIHPALNGEYEFEEGFFTNFELHAIKRLAGITSGELEEAFERLDNDLVVAIAMVALMRAGKINSRTPWASEEVDALWNATTGKIILAPEEDARPPEMTADPSGAVNASNGSSGADLTPYSEPQESAPSSTGVPD